MELKVPKYQSNPVFIINNLIPIKNIIKIPDILDIYTDRTKVENNTDYSCVIFNGHTKIFDKACKMAEIN